MAGQVPGIEATAPSQLNDVPGYMPGPIQSDRLDYNSANLSSKFEPVFLYAIHDEMLEDSSVILAPLNRSRSKCDAKKLKKELQNVS